MKLIVMMTDTFRRDHISAYDKRFMRTPNIDRLAAMSHIFDHYYVGSFPTGPNRRDMHLGRGPSANHPFNNWTPMKDDEIPLAQRLSAEGVHTMMISDVANCMTKERNYYKGFDAWRLIRGQEGDPCWSDDSVPLDFGGVPPELIRYPPERWRQILVNRASRRNEEDWFAPMTYGQGRRWIERNYTRENFMLWLETFDPHEPWDPPQWYRDMYDPGYEGRVFEAPVPGLYRKMNITDREMKHVHALYCGECAMVDNAVGAVMQTLDQVGILDETAIIFTSDHGSFFGLEGDYGLTRKCNYIVKGGVHYLDQPWDSASTQALPMFPPIIRIPLLIRPPGQNRSHRHQQITQPWDITPTVMDLFNLPLPGDFQGRSLLPAMKGEKISSRNYAFTSGKMGCRQATSKNWIYSVFAGVGQKPWLMNLKHYPRRYDNVADEHPDVCRRMRKALADFDPKVADLEDE